MTIEQFIDTLSKIQFNQSLSLSTYFFIALISSIVSICSIYVTGYLKEKSKLDFIKKNLTEINTQLAKNTETTKSIEHQFIQQTWINQQVWIKKQEIYEDIFKIFLDLDSYLDLEKKELNIYYWFEYGVDQYFDDESGRITKEDKDKLYQDVIEYRNKFKTGEFNKKMDTLRENRNIHLNNLANILHLKSIFLSQESKSIIENIIEELKKEIIDDETWDEYVAKSTKSFSHYKSILILSAEKELSILG
ncbi:MULTISPECIES: hypothetical protein [Proteus]|uniref:hypothetical protein n=1 Tax=Proteus TaxID=583 RepID=UPI000DE94068|nr:hypothetical protein [Proteus mirabilis]MDC9754535.1 hypothetical protein [Proteus mirabilis]NBN61561.1 hypothetical protein [Proteus sp. G2639]RCE56259.1 hypothetical protein C6A90_02420 [Proteus mirabilis]